ncbi:MAG: C-type lectin domain-containing protein [Myxococcota bacterium]
MKITRRTLILHGLFISLALSIAACSGSGINGDDFQGSITGSDDVAEMDDASMSDVEGTPSDAPGTEPDPYPALDCLVDTCSGQECRNSSTCVIGLVCMSACTDAACAEACIAESDEEDQDTLNGLLTCAVDEGCFGEVASAPECGDLVCEEGEDAESCPADCQGAGTGCLEERCELGNCLDVTECAEVVTCMGDCTTAECAEGCIALAPPQAEAMLQAIVDCGAEAECFGPVGPGTTDPECGDETCDDSETCESCAADCGECSTEGGACCEPHDGAGCASSACSASVCEGIPSCCEDSWTAACAEIALGLCDICASNPVEDCGDGECQDSESATSCPQDCDEAPPASCIADNCDLGQCLAFDICAEVVTCMDACTNTECAEGCLDDAPGAVLGLLNSALSCGTEAGCFGDTPPPPTDDCLETSCDAGNCADFPECAEALECMSGCTTEGCATACIEATPSIFQPPLSNLLSCGLEAGCFGGGSVCGDGWCVPPESAESCPEDCEGGPTCGDGTCGGGEGCNTCPDDCGECDGPCCSPHDEQGCGNSDCQAAVCAVDQGCCYDNWSWECAQLAAGVCPACSDGVICGDGECAPAENSSNCPADCSVPANDFLSCMYEVCEEAMDTCFDDGACSDAFPCLEDCVNNGGQGCTSTCMPDPESDIFYELGLCGGQNGCGNICGDGSCGPGETNQSCPEDCSAPPPEPEGCSNIGETDDGGQFWVCTDEAPWQEARNSCLELGGDLASIRSSAENQTIQSGLVNTAWIGLNDLEEEDDFQWSDGADVTFTNWNGGEPNDYGSGEDCTEVIASVGNNVWNDANCDAQRDYVCRVGGDDPGTDPGGPEPPDPGGGDSCVTDNCEVGWQCSWGGCEEAIACVANCDSAECAAGCVEDAAFWQKGAIEGLAECAAASGCF